METGNELFELLMDNRLKQVPLLIFANKQDLPNAMTSSEVAEAIGLVRLEDRTWEIRACSAVEGSGIKVNTFNRSLFTFKLPSIKDCCGFVSN